MTGPMANNAQRSHADDADVPVDLCCELAHIVDVRREDDDGLHRGASSLAEGGVYDRQTGC